MFKLFKKYDKNRVGLNDWDIDIGPGFKTINNVDSIQFVNEDESRIIYFSILEISGNPLITDDVLSEEPKIIGDANGWQLKGVKKAAGKILVCLISFKDQADTKWAKELFNSIVHKAVK